MCFTFEGHAVQVAAIAILHLQDLHARVANVQRKVLEHARNVRVVDGRDELDLLAVSTARGVVSSTSSSHRRDGGVGGTGGGGRGQ